MDISFFFLSVLIPTNYPNSLFYIVGLRNVLQMSYTSIICMLNLLITSYALPPFTIDLHLIKVSLKTLYVINNTFQCKRFCRCANFFFFNIFLLLKKGNAVISSTAVSWSVDY